MLQLRIQLGYEIGYLFPDVEEGPCHVMNRLSLVFPDDAEKLHLASSRVVSAVFLIIGEPFSEVRHRVFRISDVVAR